MISTPSMTEDRPVTMLGLGRMGAALATALLGAGYRTTVWNRTPGRTDRLADQGAVVAGSPAEAVAASRLVLVCLADSAGVRETLAAAAGDLSGRAVVNLTTGTPEEAAELAGWVAGQNARYLDGAMMAVPETVGTPGAFFIYSGESAVFDDHRSTLAALATPEFLGPDPDTAELWDAALLGTGYAALTGYLHGLALLASQQVPPSRFVPLVGKWLSGMIEFMPDLASEVESGDYRQGVSPVGMNLIAVDNLIALSSRRGGSTRGCMVRCGRCWPGGRLTGTGRTASPACSSCSGPGRRRPTDQEGGRARSVPRPRQTTGSRRGFRSPPDL